ncbi:hypothetical protein SprV_0200950500 [Sparganum proliferum]
MQELGASRRYFVDDSECMADVYLVAAVNQLSHNRTRDGLFLPWQDVNESASFKNKNTSLHTRISECNKADHSVTLTETEMPNRGASKLTSNKSSIHVENLTPDATETDLIDYFSKFGRVKGARVVIDSFTGQCLGYGFVTFADGDAIKNGVLDVCHFLNGRRLTVQLELPSGDSRVPTMQSHNQKRNVALPTAAKERSNDDVTFSKQTIYVGQLKRETTEADLEAYFSKFGPVRRAKIITDRDTGVSRGFGFVTFTDARTMNGGVLDACHFLHGCQIKVSPSMLRSDYLSRRTQPQVQSEPNRIYIEPLPAAVTKRDLHEYFSKFGLVKDVGLVERGKSLGRGFIVFRDLESATKVIESQPHKLNKRQITVSRTEEPRSTDTGCGEELGQSVDPNKIYLGSLPESINECNLHKYFSKFGIVMDVGVLRERKSGDHGFVDFLDSDSPIRVLESQPHQINETQITVSLDRKPGSSGTGSTNSRTLRQNTPTETHAVDLESETSPRSESLAACPEGETSGPRWKSTTTARR